jgi:hypothetical protein
VLGYTVVSLTLRVVNIKHIHIYRHTSICIHIKIYTQINIQTKYIYRQCTYACTHHTDNTHTHTLFRSHIDIHTAEQSNAYISHNQVSVYINLIHPFSYMYTRSVAGVCQAWPHRRGKHMCWEAFPYLLN